MRRPGIFRSCFIVLVTTMGLAVPVLAREAPFDGTWKISLANGPVEVSLWIVQIAGKEIKIVSGFDMYARSKLDEVRVSSKVLSFQVSVGPQIFSLEFPALPTGSMGQPLLGSARLGSVILPVWAERTTEDKLTEKNATRRADGAEELAAIGKLADTDKRIQALEKLAEARTGKSLAFIALQQAMIDRIRQKADPKLLRAQMDRHRKLCLPHGRQMQLGGNFNLARSLLNHPEGASLSVEAARAASKLLTDRDPPELKISLLLNLASGLVRTRNMDELPALALQLDTLGGAYLAQAKDDEDRLAGLVQIGSAFLASPADPVADLGLAWARKAVDQADRERLASRRIPAYKLLVRALVNRGKADEAKRLGPTIEAMELELDRSYQARGLPFEVEKYPGRKSTSTRCVLVEEFTGTQAPGCVAADLGFEGIARTYSPKELALIQYHVHIPTPDPLASDETEAHITSYKAEVNDDVPALLIDGVLTPALGGARHRAKVAYDALRSRIDKALESPADAKLTLAVSRTGEKIQVKTDVQNIKNPGPKLRLYLVLVEEQVRYQGRNGQRLHPYVARAFLGGAAGIKVAGPAQSHEATLDLGAVRKKLDSYWKDFATRQNHTWDETPLKLDKLHIVAFVQDEDTKKVYQAARAVVP